MNEEVRCPCCQRDFLTQDSTYIYHHQGLCERCKVSPPTPSAAPAGMRRPIMGMSEAELLSLPRAEQYCLAAAQIRDERGFERFYDPHISGERR